MTPTQKSEVVGATSGSIFTVHGTVAIIAGIEMDSERVTDPMTRVERVQAMAQRELARVKRLIANDAPIVGKKRGKKVKGAVAVALMPTPEQIDRTEIEGGRVVHGPAKFVEESVRTERGQVVGRAYRRQPWFESLAKREMREAVAAKRRPVIGLDELAALRFYRDAFESSQQSEMSCPLAQKPRVSSGSFAPATRTPAIALARDRVRMCESGLGPITSVFRAIVLYDQTYQQVAMERFGSRNLDVYDDALGRFISRPAPRSGRHREIIREEFLQGLRALVAATRGLVRTGE